MTRPTSYTTRLTLRDVVSEALAGLVQRPGRSVLTMLGTILGVSSFVAVLGLTTTATSQIGKSFNVLQDTTVTVEDTISAAERPLSQQDQTSFPADSDARLERLNGVAAGGVWWPLPLRNPRIANQPTAAASDSQTTLGLYAASPGALRAAQPHLTSGTLYNDAHQRRKDRVCLLGSAAAHQLGITRADTRAAVFINDTAYTVIGVIDDSERLPQTLLGITIPTSTALTNYGPPQDTPAQALIHTNPGAAQLIAQQAPLSLRPDNPTHLKAVPPPDPRSLRDQVDTDLSGLFLLLAAICLAVGAFGIANTTLVAVLERTSEIGLRRALGARPRHITIQFLTESTALGTLGGLVGTALGIAAVLATAIFREWTAVVEPYTVLPAPLIGTLVGFLAGLYPAWRAARIEPLEALRR
ncbi:ABC transporter permease [Streptomyces sp. NPDC087440]|uniref:ABC transporter permease n=1 Tax=Streptomyces sp. NPDC087440 TaxID=3365790 RepID=UPI003816257C